MKKLTMLFVFVTGMVTLLLAQPPQAFKYQAVIRNSSGEILANQAVSLRMTIRNLSPTGIILYRETFSVTTDALGGVGLEIGKGTPVSGTFAGINWRQNSKYLQTEVDPSGGSNYISMGTTELLSVPYALFSGSSGDAVWSKNNLKIYYNDGNVGIGSSDPKEKLHIHDRVRIGEDASSPTVYGELIHEGGGTGFRINAHAGGGGWADMLFQTNGTTKMFLESAGNLGIGTENPTTRLVVKSSGYTDGMYVLASDDDPLFRIRQNSNMAVGLYLYDSAANATTMLAGLGNSYMNGGRLTIGSTSDFSGKLTVTSSSGFLLNPSTEKGLVIRDGSFNSGNEFEVQNSSGDATVVITDNGNRLGLGTSSPNAKIEINGQDSEQGMRVAWGPTYGGLYGEFKHGGSEGLKINANAGGTWAKMSFQTDGTTRMFIRSNGNVGIGTENPQSRLDVQGNVTIRNQTTGDIVVELGTGLDYAEGFNVSDKENIAPGSVLCIDPENPGKLKISNQANDSKVAGIVAGANSLGSGIILGADSHDFNVALAGRVYCNADATTEAISTGDLLTTSDIPGYAKKVTSFEDARGAILGKAMESLEKGKTGQILVLVTLQ